MQVIPCVSLRVWSYWDSVNGPGHKMCIGTVIDVQCEKGFRIYEIDRTAEQRCT